MNTVHLYYCKHNFNMEYRFVVQNKLAKHVPSAET